MHNGFVNWVKLEMEMECDDLSWKKVLAEYLDRLWGSAKNLSSRLWGKSDSVTFGHIMGGCPWMLNVENKTKPSEDRYT